MAIGITLIIIAVLISAIWIIIELKRFKHKIFAIFLIALILFFYFSFTFVINEHDIDIMTISGITDASKIYFAWLVTISHNTVAITMNAIKMDWGSNSTIS